MITAQNDPLVPFGVYRAPVFQTNPALELIAPEYGGHVAFLARRNPRFWLDGVILEWLERQLQSGGTNGAQDASVRISQ